MTLAETFWKCCDTLSRASRQKWHTPDHPLTSHKVGLAGKVLRGLGRQTDSLLCAELVVPVHPKPIMTGPSGPTDMFQDARPKTEERGDGPPVEKKRQASMLQEAAGKCLDNRPSPDSVLSEDPEEHLVSGMLSFAEATKSPEAPRT